MFIDQSYPINKVLRYSQLSLSSYYYKPIAIENLKQRGKVASEYTKKTSGEVVFNDKVIDDIKELLKQEFVDYGYIKVTYYLQNTLGYIINHKKVYRLMKTAKLLNVVKSKFQKEKKLWVKNLVPEPSTAFSYWEFDIKFIHISSKGRYYPLLSVIDVYTRYLIGYMFQKSIKQADVIGFFDGIISDYKLPETVYVRNDNGSQFESKLVRDYFASKGIIQEFTLPATPQQNAHIESYHSIINSAICRRIPLVTFEQTSDLFSRWGKFYNEERIHSGIKYLSPVDYMKENKISNPKELKK
jgi:transposase InsO family protein